MAEQQQVQEPKEVPRFADMEDLTALSELGWPMDAPESFQVCVAGPDSLNPGRVFMKMGYFFCFWMDEPKFFDPEIHQKSVEKRKREQEAYKKRQLLTQDPKFQELMEKRKAHVPPSKK